MAWSKAQVSAAVAEALRKRPIQPLATIERRCYVNNSEDHVKMSDCRCGVIYHLNCPVDVHRQNAIQEWSRGITPSIVFGSGGDAMLSYSRKNRMESKKKGKGW